MIKSKSRIIYSKGWLMRRWPLLRLEDSFSHPKMKRRNTQHFNSFGPCTGGNKYRQNYSYKGGKIMKYHCEDTKSNKSLCKLVTKTPATWVFDREGFLDHHYKEGRCKICSKLLNKLGNKE